MRWPKAGDNPFLTEGSESNRRTLANLRWLANFRTDDSQLAEGFKEAADMIVGKLANTKAGKHPDIYFFPVAFLYRHSLELQMKDLLRLAISLKLIEKNETVEKVLGSHSLASLWHHTRLALVAHWPKDPKGTLKGVSAVIQKLHEADSSGQTFRYTKDRDGTSNIQKLPESVSLTRLRDTCEAISNFFYGCSAEFEHMIETDAEMRDHYEP